MRLIFTPVLAASLLFAAHARADDTLTPLHFQSQGTFGSYDKAALQRGFLVYQSVCAGCHSANELHYRDLEALGFTPDQVAGIAANVKLADGSAATLDDVFKAPPVQEAAFGGAVPPDLSNIVNERPKGLEYVYSLLTGYPAAAPDNVNLLPGHYYNLAYPGNQIAMPAPLKGNDVAYADGTQATAQQEAADVSAFLAWAADPNLDTRHAVGLRAVLFLAFLTIIAIASKRKIWRESV
jgi:ubiquinol-cytochrome c reductase cytochrome c1 subunit